MKYGRRDANHQQVIGWYRELGCSVADCADLGLGLPDLFVGAAGVTDPVEVKTADGRLTPMQQTFVQAWRGSVTRIVRDQDEVIAHVADMRRRARSIAA